MRAIVTSRQGVEVRFTGHKSEQQHIRSVRVRAWERGSRFEAAL